MTWRSPLCRFKISTICLPSFANWRVFLNLAGDCAWQSFIRSTPPGASSKHADFVIKGDYLRAFKYADTVERDSLMMTFHSQHRPLEGYFLALEKAGFLVEALREPSVPEHAAVSETSRRWHLICFFLHLRALRP